MLGSRTIWRAEGGGKEVEKRREEDGRMNGGGWESKKVEDNDRR
jgi:hypothetical protein